MKRTLFFLFILFLIPTYLFSAGKRISINDLVVNSHDPKLEYVGKGIAEMIAVELVKSRSVSLIAREKRTKLLEESEFALSDLADPDSQVELGRMLAGTLTTAFFNKKLFLSLKGIGDIYPEDRSGYTIRAIPAIEFWLLTFLAIRGGYEYAQMDISDRFKIGHGGFGGISLILGKWEFNANFTYRNKPIHLLPGYSLNDNDHDARSGQERYLLAALSKEYCLILQPHFTCFNQAGQLIPYLQKLSRGQANIFI